MTLDARVSSDSSPSLRPERWSVVFYGALCLAMTAPGQTVGVSVFVDPIIETLGLSRSQISGAYLVATLLGALALPAVGRAIDTWGVRRVLIMVVIAFALALGWMSSVTNLAMLAIGFLGIRMLGQGSLTLAATTSVTLSFHRRRGMAVGMSNAIGIALMSLAPLFLAAVIAGIGWRGAWWVAAGLVLAVVLPVAGLGFRSMPGLRGPGPALPVATGSDEPGPSLSEPVLVNPSWSRPEAMRTGMFWVLALAIAVVAMIGTGLAFHQISLLGERGLSVTQAAANFVPQTVAGIGASLAAGVLVDRVAPRFLVSASMGSLVFAMVLAQVAAPGWRAVAFGVCLGAGGGAIRSLEAAAFPRYYGLAHIGEIRGFVMALTVGATAFGPFALSLAFENLGSYGAALNLLLPLPLAVALAALAVRPPAPKTVHANQE